MTEILESLNAQFRRKIDMRLVRPDLLQIFIPIYHEDGDMVSIYLRLPSSSSEPVIITDMGSTLMRLSYDFEIDTDTRKRIYKKLLNENGLSEEKGTIYLVSRYDELYASISQFAYGLAKIASLSNFRREVVRSMFYEDLDRLVFSDLAQYHPQKKYHPLKDHEEFEVDYCFNSRAVPLYLFAVSSRDRANLATIATLSFLNSGLRFKTAVVHEDFESLDTKTRERLLSATDKQFPTLGDFKLHASQYFERELSSST
jgi:hypothetical protein